MDILASLRDAYFGTRAGRGTRRRTCADNGVTVALNQSKCRRVRARLLGRLRAWSRYNARSPSCPSPANRSKHESCGYRQRRQPLGETAVTIGGGLGASARAGTLRLIQPESGERVSISDSATPFPERLRFH